jgi:uncharacterized protein VirK/YbjX
MDEIQGRPIRPSANTSPVEDLKDWSNAMNSGLTVLSESDKSFGLIRSLLIVARQGIKWSPFQILGELWRLFTNIDLRRKIVSLVRLQPFDGIVQHNPGLALKYVVPNYLARGFTLTERAACFLHHYSRMHVCLPERVLSEILQGYTTLHEVIQGDNHFAITLGLPTPPFDREGELFLGLRVNDGVIFNLCFTIIPGWVVRSKTAEILLITRLQGAKGCNSQIRLARHAFCDYSPRGPLLAALQGIANAFGICEVEAVCATNQRFYRKESDALLRRGYDDFFTHLGMVKTAAGFYSSPVPIEGKPLALFKGRYRSRARKRRAMRQQIQLACATFLKGVTNQAALSSSVAANPNPVRIAAESSPSGISCQESGYNPAP